MYVVTRTKLSERHDPTANTLNSPQIIIIKKSDIGLEGYQHQKYQYNLLNNLLQRTGYYEDLAKVRDRLDRGIPSMQHVIDMDMKRARANKVHERRLQRILKGPKGLDRQYKQKLQRLQNRERNIEQDLKRLNEEIARIGVSDTTNPYSPKNQKKELQEVPSPFFSSSDEDMASIQMEEKQKSIFNKSIPTDKKALMNSSYLPIIKNKATSTMAHFTPSIQNRSLKNKGHLFNEKLPPVCQRSLENNGSNRLFQHHIEIINQEKQHVEQRLKEFLN